MNEGEEDFNEYPSDYPFDLFGEEEGEVIDPASEVMHDLAINRGITDFEGLFLEAGEFAPSELRGQRFSNIVDALNYLLDAGILAFSGITQTEDGLYAPVIEPRTDKMKGG